MRRVQGGFTLVEMLVALSIASLLVSLVYGAVRVGQRSAQALGVQTHEAEVMRIGWQFLHDAIAQAQPVPDPENPGNRTGFSGARDTVEFIADMPGHVGIGGLMRIHLGNRIGTDGKQLVLTRTRLQQAGMPADDQHNEQAVLVEDLDSLQIAYFGQQGSSAIPAWHPSWDAPRTLPNLVSIAVRPGTGAAWPVLVASPMLGTSPLEENALTPGTAEAVTSGAILP